MDSWDYGERGAPGVTVKLWQGTELVETQITDWAGDYLFADVTDDVYSLEFIPPAGFLFSARDAGDDDYDSDVDPATGFTAPFTYTYSVSETTQSHWDAGLARPGTIGNRVWEDLDNNGLQHAGEPGIAGVAVHLLQEGAVIATATTDADGHYYFFDVPDGVYDVQIAPENFASVLAGYTPSARDQGFDRMPDLNLGRFPVRSLAEAQIMVERIIAYETEIPAGDWQKRALFVADNVDAEGFFPDYADAVAEQYWPYPNDITKLYYLQNYTSAVLK